MKADDGGFELMSVVEVGGLGEIIHVLRGACAPDFPVSKIRNIKESREQRGHRFIGEVERDYVKRFLGFELVAEYRLSDRGNIATRQELSVWVNQAKDLGMLSQGDLSSLRGIYKRSKGQFLPERDEGEFVGYLTKWDRVGLKSRDVGKIKEVLYPFDEESRYYGHSRCCDNYIKPRRSRRNTSRSSESYKRHEELWQAFTGVKNFMVDIGPVLKGE